MKPIYWICTLFVILVFGGCCCFCDDEPDPCFCPEYYDPVCGVDGFTYSNPCFAECAGVDYEPGPCPERKIAIVRWTGALEVDGCDWVLEIENITYHPDTLAEEFKSDELPVWVVYKETLQRFTCGFITPIPVLEVIQVEERK